MVVDALFGCAAISKLISWMIWEIAVWIWVICVSIAATLGDVIEGVPGDTATDDPVGCERSRMTLASSVPSPS